MATSQGTTGRDVLHSHIQGFGKKVRLTGPTSYPLLILRDHAGDCLTSR